MCCTIDAGSTVQLPADFTAHQLRLVPGSREGNNAGACWESVALSGAITYWNHDATPCSTDPSRRCLDWLSLAAAVGGAERYPGAHQCSRLQHLGLGACTVEIPGLQQALG